MSYIVLARKWRPRIFDDLRGQDTIVHTLKNALSSGRIVHAYLFSGPRGVGKTSTARILAKALNCVNGPTSEPCGVCDQCISITEGTSVDVIEIDGASNTQVDSIRELRESVKYAPSSGRYKVYIIDEVHMLSTSAFNALLKTLEEPPSHVIFIFATTEPKKIPPTIHSRCQHHAFRKIPKDIIMSQLREVIKGEGIRIRDDSLEMIARAADGSMRDALTLLDQISSFSEEITVDEVREILGLPDAEVIQALSDAIIDGDTSKTISLIKGLTDKGYDMRFLIRELIEHFRNLTIVKITKDAGGILELTEDEIERLRSQASGLGVEQLTLLMTELLRLEPEVRTSQNPRYTLELGLLRMSFIKGMASVSDILKRLDNLSTSRDATPSTPAAEEEKEPAEERQRPSTAPPDRGTDINDRDGIWQALVETIDSEDHLLAGKLMHARAVDVSDKDFTIGFNGGMSMLAGLIKDKTPLIEEGLYRITGKRLNLKIIDLPEEKTRGNNKSIRERVIADPVVQGVIRLFNSSIVEVRPLKNSDKQE
jgi:DNA polymerase-3 subunit gamma/tau